MGGGGRGAVCLTHAIGGYGHSFALIQKATPPADVTLKKPDPQQPQRIALIQYAGNRGGSAISGHMILEAMKSRGWRVETVFGFYGTFSDEYGMRGETIHCVPHTWLGAGTLRGSLSKMLQAAQATWRFLRVFARIRPSLVYINTLVSIPAAVAARIKGIPVVWHVRELFTDEGGELVIPRVGGKRLVQWLLDSIAARVIVNSQAVADNVLGTGSQHRYEVIPNAVSQDYSPTPDGKRQARLRFNLDPASVVIGVPGTIRRVKGHSFFLESMARILCERTELAVIISGDVNVPFFGELGRLVDRLGIMDKVHFLGDLQDMGFFYRACDVVCVPSRAETFGRTVIEAFVAEIPVIATAVGGINEIIEDGQTGLLVGYGDSAALQAAVLRMLDDRKLQERLARNAKARAREVYQPTVYKHRVVSVIKEVLAEA